MNDITIQHSQVIERILTLEIVRVTERAAVAAARLRGQGRKNDADQAAVDAMRRELNRLDIDGEVVIGEGELDEAPMLYIGEKVGTKQGPRVSIAVDPLEGTNLCAKNQPNSCAVIAIAEEGTLLNAPDVYMDKIAIGPGYAPGLVSLDAPIQANLQALAKAKGVKVQELTVCILDRERHQPLVNSIREVGAAIQFLTDGDVAGVIACTDPSTGVDMYVGIGGAPEGVLAAAALRCVGGQMQGRLIFDDKETLSRAEQMGISDPKRLYTLNEMASGDVLFAATGVTTGQFLNGVEFLPGLIRTDTVVMRSATGTVRRIRADHRQLEKFFLD